jgi:hypothetical protein
MNNTKNKLAIIYNKLPKNRFRTQFRRRFMQAIGIDSPNTFYNRLNSEEITEAEIIIAEKVYNEIAGLMKALDQKMPNNSLLKH